MIKYSLLTISLILSLLIGYQLLNNQKDINSANPISENNSNINRDTIIKIPHTPTISQPIKKVKKKKYQKENVPMDTTYNPLLNKTVSKTIANEEFEEIEKGIRTQIGNVMITTVQVPYNDEILLDTTYSNSEKNSANINLSKEKLLEYEGDIIMPNNNIQYLQIDENISSIIDAS